MYRIGIDVGGTFTDLELFDARKRQLHDILAGVVVINRP